MSGSDAFDWTPLDDVDDLAVGEMKEVELPGGKLVLVMRGAGGLHASCADCPHQDMPLSDGMFDGTTLTCMQHLWQWDVATGAPKGEAELPLEMFELKQEGGEWLIRSRR